MLQAWIRRLEKALSYTRLGISFYARPYKRVIEREWSLLKLDQSAHIVFIGAGAIPFTAIWLARLYDCHIDAYDLDAKAISQAKKVVKKLGLGSKINLFHGTATTTLKPYDAAFIALQVRPLEAVIDILFASGTHRLIVRRPSQGYVNQYDVLPSTFTITDRVTHPLKAFAESVRLDHNPTV